MLDHDEEFLLPLKPYPNPSSHTSFYAPFPPSYGSELEYEDYSDTAIDGPRRLLMKYKKGGRRTGRLDRQTRHILHGSNQFYPSTTHEDYRRLSAFCVCLKFDMPALVDALRNKHDEGFEKSSLALYQDILAIKQDDVNREIFVFYHGCVVFYNASESYEAHILNHVLAPFALHRLETAESEDFEYTYGSKFQVVNDRIVFESDESLEKLSVALALAQCVKLNVYEEEIDREIAVNHELPLMLAEEGKITLSQREIQQKMGKLFIVRNDVNLHFDVLDTPEFFWEQDVYKPVYDRLYQYLELNKRVKCLNMRLEIMKELFEMLAKQLTNKHATRLEWIVIWLILIQVLMEVLSDGLRVFGSHN